MSVKFSKNKILTISFLLLIAINFAYLHYCAGPVDIIKRPLDLWEPFCYVCFDSSIIMIFCYILALGNLKIAGTLGVSVSLLWSILNVLYSRYFNVYFNYHDISEASNLNEGFMWDAIASALRKEDCLYLFVIFTLVALLFFVKIEKSSLRSRMLYGGLLALFPIFIIMIYGGGKVLLSAASELRHLENRKSRRAFLSEYREKTIFQNGVFCAQLFDDYIIEEDNHSLTPNEIEEIKSFIQSSHNEKRVLSRKDKNLIFILVESYLAVSSDMVINGKELTPCLNRIRHTEGVYYNDSVTSNIELGVSGDGQFIYMTGLLPLKGKITITRAIKNKIPALPMLISDSYDYKTLMTIPTKPTMWSQTEMCKTYGIQQLYSTNDMDFNINDSTIFDYSFNNELELVDKRFFHTILTISMHCPYMTHSPEYFDFPSYYSPEFCEYLRRCAYTDRQIGRFIQKLKDHNLYDNSVIVICADHEPTTEMIKVSEEYSGNKRLPLFIINSEMDLQTCWYGPMNQIDLFPTLLDIFGIDSDWRGLGCSVTDAVNYKNHYNDFTHHISALIIDSDYFSKYHK